MFTDCVYAFYLYPLPSLKGCTGVPVYHSTQQYQGLGHLGCMIASTGRRPQVIESGEVILGSGFPPCPSVYSHLLPEKMIDLTKHVGVCPTFWEGSFSTLWVASYYSTTEVQDKQVMG